MTDSPSTPPFTRLPATARLDSLDSLRGVAILMVILFHVSVPFQPGNVLGRVLVLGNAGVQLFFLVSAVTMCHMWAQRADEPMRHVNFYIRRLFRIAPLFWFAMLLYTALWGTGPRGTAYDGIGPTQFVLSALFLHGFSPSAINAVVPGGWSIAVEMSFYMVFPWLATLRPERLMLAAFASYLVLGMLCTHWLIHVDGSKHMALFLYYSLLTQFPVFLIGLLVYWVGVRRWQPRLGPMLSVAGAWLAIALAGKFAYGLTSPPFVWVEIAALALAMVPIISLGAGNVALAYVGRLSYSMYLFHFAVIAGLEQWFGPKLPFALALIATLAGTLAIGVVSQRTAEKWSQDAGRALIRSLSAARRHKIWKNT